MLHGKFQFKGGQLTLGKLKEAIDAKRPVFLLVTIDPGESGQMVCGITTPQLTIDTEKPCATLKFSLVDHHQEYEIDCLYVKGQDILTLDWVSDGFHDVTFYSVMDIPVKNENDFYENVALQAGRWHNHDITAEEFAFTVNRFWDMSR